MRIQCYWDSQLYVHKRQILQIGFEASSFPGAIPIPLPAYYSHTSTSPLESKRLDSLGSWYGSCVYRRYYLNVHDVLQYCLTELIKADPTLGI